MQSWRQWTSAPGAASPVFAIILAIISIDLSSHFFSGKIMQVLLFFCVFSRDGVQVGFDERMCGNNQVEYWVRYIRLLLS